MSNIPKDLKYTKSHEWICIQDDVAVIGITDHAQSELTDIVYVELPEVGRTLAKGEQCAVVESVKTASDIYAPAAGEVLAINKDLESGKIHLIVGTHALIQEGVNFKNLGMIIVDEQHRFGVQQRKALIDKGYFPEVLALTATPIPRTLTFTIHGDMGISIIDELPKNLVDIKING